MKFYEKYRKILFSAIKLAFPIGIGISLAVSLYAYPAYSRLFPASLPKELSAAVLMINAVLSLCRFLVSVDSGEGAERAFRLFLSFAIFAAAYYFKNAGGFAVRGYVLSFAAQTAAICSIPVSEKRSEGKRKLLALSFFVVSELLFTAISVFSAIACVFRSEITASVIIRLCAYPMLFLLLSAIFYGLKCGAVSRVSYYSALLFSFAVSAFVFVTSFAFEYAGIACTVFSGLFAVFFAVCTADILIIRRSNAHCRS